MKNAIVLICAALALSSCRGETGTAKQLWPWQVESVKVKAESGDGAAQYTLYEHFLASGDHDTAGHWFDKCIANQEPICLYEEAGAQYLGAAMNDFGSKKRLEGLQIAEGTLNRAEDHLKPTDLLSRGDIRKFRSDILRARTDKNFKP